MTLQDVRETLKGGGGSGDFGHIGRAGKRGGSGGGGGKGKPRKGRRSRKVLDKEIEARKKPKKLKPRDILEEKMVSHTGVVSDDIGEALKKYGDAGVETMMNSYDGFTHNGLTSKINDFHYAVIDGDRKVLAADGVIHNKDGATVGRFFKTMDKVDGKLVVDIYAVEMNEAEQGKGFGSRFYQHSEKELIKGGVSKITLQANLSVGGYAWARMGFDYARGKPSFDMTAHMVTEWRSRYGNVDGFPDTNNKKPWEIASLKGPDGHRIGKEMLLGSTWNGVKDLSEGSESRKVGDAYYVSKSR